MFQSSNIHSSHATCTVAMAFLLFLATARRANAQQTYYRFYSTNDGLPSNTIAAEPQKKPIFQDQKGFIWFATFGGISIYDGYHFTNYTTENGGLTDDIAFVFFERSEDEVWVVESSCTDVFVNRKRIRSIPIQGYQLANYLLTREGRVLTARDGYVFEIRDYKPVKIASFPFEITRIHEAGNSFLIENFSCDSVYLVDKSFTTILQKQKGKIFRDRQHQYWYINSQVHLLDTLGLKKGTIRFLASPPPMDQMSFKGKNISDFLPDADGYYWLIDNKENGVTRIDQRGAKKQFHINANSLMEDAEGNIWMPGGAGFTKFYNKRNDFYSQADGLSSEYVTGITEDESNGAAWMIHKKGVSCVFQDKVYNFPRLDYNSGWSSIKAQGDSLWVLTGSVYLYKIFYQSVPKLRLVKKWTPVEETSDFISCMQIDKSGTQFVNLQDHGLFRTRGGHSQKICGPGLFSFLITGNELWTGSINEGATRWKVVEVADSIQLRLIKKYDRLPGGRINTIVQDSAGNLWMGTLYKGVLKFERQKNDSFLIRNFFSAQGLANQWVIKISINRGGEVYAGTMGGGIFQLHSIGDSVYFENLTAKYGGIAATWDFVNDSQNNFWLATPLGAVHVRNDLLRKTTSPKVFFTQLRMNNIPDSSIFYNARRRFSYKQNNLAFEFSATSYQYEDKVLYSYQLAKGRMLSQWSVPQQSHAVSLVSLAPGDYLLKVKAVTAEGVWSNSPVEYRFTIARPYWATWWFRAFIFLVLVTAAAFVYRYRINQLKALLRIRTKISRDLHDDVGSTLSGIGLLSEVAIQQVRSGKVPDALTSLHRINNNSEETLEKMADIVWAINPQNDSFEKVINRLKSYAKATAEPIGIQLHFDLEKDLQRFDMDMQRRSNVYLICKEAINNAIKYSECRNLCFGVRQENHQLSVSIMDDGKGFNAECEFEGNGLKNMKSRAAEIKARLNVNSEKDQGTHVNLSLKII